jgi:hypothetical protein
LKRWKKVQDSLDVEAQISHIVVGSERVRGPREATYLTDGQGVKKVLLQEMAMLLGFSISDTS